MQDELARSSLGRKSPQPAAYDPDLLFAIPRAPARAELGLDAEAPLPFAGQDVWTAYELSWLDARGKPMAAMGELRVPAVSPRLVESKSVKLYLQGFHAERLDSADALRARVVEDVSRATGAQASLEMIGRNAPFTPSVVRPGESLDALDLSFEHYGLPLPGLLTSDSERHVEETLATEAFKSNCPVTGQPDFASIWIRYRGARIDRAALLRYLVSYREHAALHEQCVERIFCDLQSRCGPEALAVSARFTRRGGIDINPQRASRAYAVDWPGRTLRQ